MTSSLDGLLSELERFGQANDGANSERSRQMLNITRETGQFLSVLVRATSARRVLEIGTSNGYSTLWLASAARDTGGTVTTVEFSEYKTELAQQNFGRSGLAASIRLVNEDARLFLNHAADESVDLIFLDAERLQYPGWWPDLKRVLRTAGLLVVDNATSHPQQLAPFVSLVESDDRFTTSLVPIGKGEFLAVKAAA